MISPSTKSQSILASLIFSNYRVPLSQCFLKVASPLLPLGPFNKEAMEAQEDLLAIISSSQVPRTKGTLNDSK